MPKQKIEIEVDVPDGYEATGEFRKAIPGDSYLGNDGSHCCWTENDTEASAFRYIILRKKFVWPPWLKAAAIVKDIDGSWWAHSKTPTLHARSWCGGEICILPLDVLDIDLPDVPWDKSLIVNTNRSEDMSYQWKWMKVDKPGLWAFGGKDRDKPPVFDTASPLVQYGYMESWRAYLGPIPDIAPPEPELPEARGGFIEVTCTNPMCRGRGRRTVMIPAAQAEAYREGKSRPECNECFGR